MDQILHRKLINEKNNLQLEVAKANKEIAKLMETVQQYEAVLASNEEENENKLGGSKFETSGNKMYPSLGSNPTAYQRHAAAKKRLRSTSKTEVANKPTISEATLVRGMEAAKLKAKLSGKKLPTAAEAAEQTKKIEAEKELEQAGLGKLKKQRKQIDEVLDSTLDKKLAANVAKHSLQQKKDEQKMLGHMPGVTPARMTLLAQQAKNRESLLNRLGKGKEMGENGMGTSADMDLRRLQRKSGIDLGATIGPEGIHVSGDPSKTAAMTQRHMQLQKAAGAKPARPHYYIKGNPAHG
jgi:hypothetical protein